MGLSLTSPEDGLDGDASDLGTVTFKAKQPMEPKENVNAEVVRTMDKIRENLNGYYVLMNDIDLAGVGEWAPIGDNGSGFTGVLDGGKGQDGKGHTIENLKITTGGRQYVGLFGAVEGKGIVERVHLKKPASFLICAKEK